MKHLIFATMAALARAGHEGPDKGPGAKRPPGPGAAGPPATGSYVYNAPDEREGMCNGIVRYGSRSKNVYVDAERPGMYLCGGGFFEDPLPGEEKACWCLGDAQETGWIRNDPLKG